MKSLYGSITRSAVIAFSYVSVPMMLFLSLCACARRATGHATFRVPCCLNRLTNSSAFSATARQPASIVSECPRPGFLTISVTPVLLLTLVGGVRALDLRCLVLSQLDCPDRL